MEPLSSCSSFACCLVTCDPPMTPGSWLTLPRILLTDHHLREELISLTRELTFSGSAHRHLQASPGDTAREQGRLLLARDIGSCQSLKEFLKSRKQARAASVTNSQCNLSVYPDRLSSSRIKVNTISHQHGIGPVAPNEVRDEEINSVSVAPHMLRAVSSLDALERTLHSACLR